MRRSSEVEGDDDEKSEDATEPAPLAAPSADGGLAPAEDAGAKAPPGPCDKYPSSKYCNGKCVYIDDPLYGCSPTSCMPCILPHASAKCEALKCVIAQCADEDWGDCDGNASNGCERDLDTRSSCGGCGIKCGGSTPYCNHGDCSATPRTD